MDREVISQIKSFAKIKNKIKELGYLSHAEVLEKYNEASVLLLLLFNSQSGKGNYPGKIFEYFAAKRPILAFGPEESDSSKLIGKIDYATYFSYDMNSHDIAKQIMDLFNSRKKNILSSFDINQFSRQELTRKLADLLKTI